MPEILYLPTFKDERGCLTVIEKHVPFDVRRVYYIYDVQESERGMHKHKKTVQLAVAVKGSCSIFCKTSENGLVDEFFLDSPGKAILLFPNDFHWMNNFSSDCVLLVLASEKYDPDDYIHSI